MGARTPRIIAPSGGFYNGFTVARTHITIGMSCFVEDRMKCLFARRYGKRGSGAINPGEEPQTFAIEENPGGYIEVCKSGFDLVFVASVGAGHARPAATGLALVGSLRVSPGLGMCLTQVGAVGSAWWGGRPRPRGGPCLRFRQRDGGVPRGPGGPPHQAAARAIT